MSRLQVDVTAAGRVAASFAAEPAELVVIVGPNGAGKTSLLRVVAGLDPADGGVTVDGSELTAGQVAWMPASVGLLPHRAAEWNVAVAASNGRRPKAEHRQQARWWLAHFDAADLADRRPLELSGGERARVGLARAFAAGRAVVALDEPLAPVDAARRPTLRRQIAAAAQTTGTTVLMVSHDGADAAAIGDRVMVIEEGQATALATPDELAAAPASRFVAELVGVNRLHGEAAGGRVSGDGWSVVVAESAEGSVTAVIHPHSVSLHADEPAGSPRNHGAATVVGIERGFGTGRVRVRLDGRPSLVAEVTEAAVAELGLALGQQIWWSVKATEITVF